MTKLNVNFNYNAWDEYLEWKKEDKKTSKKIDGLIRDCQRHPFTGKGKPEPLKANLSGTWSRKSQSQRSYGLFSYGNRTSNMATKISLF
ncbi:RelE family toxin-antitoxin system [Lactobacillus helveticus CIRM-BIA 951]|uniref:Endoribonuclease YoeB n=1 Tax=Lactobacillus helveticus CIRM-BIA 951 TaxID=1226334 RepID=U6F0V3_LACHE|nr:RelE family toxin-antitoxin system [Lactobacillus helveticus CIRM-BIA 951]